MSSMTVAWSEAVEQTPSARLASKAAVQFRARDSFGSMPAWLSGLVFTGIALFSFLARTWGHCMGYASSSPGAGYRRSRRERAPLRPSGTSPFQQPLRHALDGQPQEGKSRDACSRKRRRGLFSGAVTPCQEELPAGRAAEPFPASSRVRPPIQNLWVPFKPIQECS